MTVTAKNMPPATAIGIVILKKMRRNRSRTDREQIGNRSGTDRVGTDRVGPG